MPITIPDVAVPEGGGEGNQVATDAIMIARGLREGLVGAGEPQVMEPETRFVFGLGNAQRVDEPAERSPDRIAVKAAAVAPAPAAPSV